MTDEVEEDRHTRIDVYHHFGEDIENLVATLTKLLSSPIVIDITVSADGVPTALTVIFGTPENN